MGLVVLVVAVVAALGFGAVYQRRNGRVRATAATSVPAAATGSAAPDTAAPDTVAADPVAAAIAGLLPAGDGNEARATLLQFSTAFCAPCRTTRRILGGIAETVPGIRHLEIDAESHLEAVRALDIRRTPTVLVLDAANRVVARASGAPRRDEVLATLARVLGEPAAGRPVQSQPVA